MAWYQERYDIVKALYFAGARYTTQEVERISKLKYPFLFTQDVARETMKKNLEKIEQEYTLYIESFPQRAFEDFSVLADFSKDLPEAVVNFSVETVKMNILEMMKFSKKRGSTE